MDTTRRYEQWLNEHEAVEDELKNNQKLHQSPCELESTCTIFLNTGECDYMYCPKIGGR